MDVKYLISASFPYDKLICGDAGPAFARDYDWPVARLGDDGLERSDIIIVDTRFPANEFDKLGVLFRKSRAMIVLRLNDPLERDYGHHWTQFVIGLLDKASIHVMLTYTPAVVTGLIFAKARKSRFIFAPYVYDPECEYSIDHSGRRGDILISGAMDPDIYPIRTRISRTARVWLPLRLKASWLEHPGYPDLTGKAMSHSVVGNRYIETLRKFRYAAVCSSIARIELLKYRELAYAGIVPLGDMPASLIDCPGNAYIKWRRNFIALAASLPGRDESEAMATAYRAFLRKERDMARMRARVEEDLASL